MVDNTRQTGPLALWARITEPHPSIRDRNQRRVLRLIATWHLVGAPVAPIIAVLLVSRGQYDASVPVWTVGSQVVTLGGFLATRSRFGPKSLPLQVAALVLLIGTACCLLPDSSPATSALLLPVLTAGFCLKLRHVLLTQAATGGFLILKSLTLGGLDPAELGGTLGVLFSGFVLSAALVWQREGMARDELMATRLEARRARALLDAAFHGTALIQAGRFEEVSDGFARVLGTSGEALLGRPLSEAAPFLVTERTAEDAVPMLDATGSLRYLDVVRQPLGDAAEETEVIAVRDETRNELHRANLQFVDRMTSLGSLTAGVAHEVNNALHSVLGHVDISRSFAKRNNLGQVERSLGLIGSGAERIADCMDQLQRFSTTRDTPPQPIDLGAVVSSTVELAHHRIRHAATLELEVSEGLPLVTCRESHIAQIVMNLLLNAADAVRGTPDARIAITAFEDPVTQEIVLEVSDSGPGVPREVVQRIFQPFFTTKEAGKGSGLGLSISASIAAQMGATLTLGEGPLGGACFTLRIVPNAVRDHANIDGVPTELSPSDIVLVVDDEPEMEPVFANLLAPAQVRCVRSVSEAKESWSADLAWVLSDIVMPRESGLDLRRWVHTMHPNMVDRFVLMTGSAVDLGDAVDLLPATQLVLEKPLRRETLLRKLTMHLQDAVV